MVVTRGMFLWSGLVLVLAGCATQPADQSTAAAEEIRAADIAWEKVFTGMDTSAALGFIEPSGSMLAPNVPIATGHDAIQSVITGFYSLPDMKEELAQYAVRFSNYEGGATIGTYLVDRAEERDIELVDFYVFVPAYDFSELSETLQGVRIETDYKAWYDLTRRFNHMFDLGIDLSDLARQADEITASMDAEINQLNEKMPELHVRDYMQKLAKNFTEISFMPLDDVWERELGDLFGDSKDQ